MRTEIEPEVYKSEKSMLEMLIYSNVLKSTPWQHKAWKFQNLLKTQH